MPASVHFAPGVLNANGDPEDVIATIVLPPTHGIENIDTGSLRVSVGNATIGAQNAQPMGDTDMDGLSELQVILDGDAVRAALPNAPGFSTAVLTGEMDDGTDLRGAAVLRQTSLWDADCNGTLGASDITQVLRGASSLSDEPDCLEIADTDCDGDTDVADSLNVALVLAGLEPVGVEAGCQQPATVMAPEDAHRPAVQVANLLAAAMVLPVLGGIRRKRK